MKKVRDLLVLLGLNNLLKREALKQQVDFSVAVPMPPEGDADALLLMPVPLPSLSHLRAKLAHDDKCLLCLISIVEPVQHPAEVRGFSLFPLS
ncbi:hypothetical protein Daqu01_03429 [Deinococcus aquaticus]